LIYYSAQSVPAKHIKPHYQQKPSIGASLRDTGPFAGEIISGRAKHRHTNYKLGMPILLVTDLVSGE